MANPQIEDGYTKIANEIMDALCRFRIPGEERQVLDSILRKTYGWNKCEDKISMGQIAEMTGLKRQNVSRAIQSLLSKKITLVIKSDDRGINVLKFNKNYHEWVSSKVITPKKSVIKSDDRSVIKSDSHKRKEINKHICSQDFEKFYSVYPKKKKRAEAEKAFSKINPDEGLLKIIISAVERSKQSEDWIKENGQYIPYPSSWLNGRRWEDELITVPLKVKSAW